MDIDNDNEILKLKTNLSKKKEDTLIKNLNDCSISKIYKYKLYKLFNFYLFLRIQ
jgi:hypothetical protein